MTAIPNIIELEGVSFGYNKQSLLLDQLTLKIPQHAIYGFIGHNGAGKTTTMRLILGLLHPQAGKISIFGKEGKYSSVSMLARTGSLIETPPLYEMMTAYENLKLACKYLALSYVRIDEVAEMVRLQGQLHKKVRQYSTGMKQRLGLALALLRDPDLLILDEPTNGLDPQGIKDFRLLMEQLRQMGKTIFLSSHLLSEVEKMATHVGILQEGKLRFSGTIGELNQARMSHLKVQVKVSAASRVSELISSHVLDNETLILSVNSREELSGYIKKIINAGISVYEVVPQKSDLEEIFLDTLIPSTQTQ